MGREGRACGQCGAAARDDGRFCAYCGAELPAPAAPPHPLGDVDARLAAVERHPDLPRLNRHTPSTGMYTGGMFFGVVFGVVFAGFALFILSGFTRMRFTFALFPALFVLIGVGVAVGSVVKGVRFAKAPLRRTPAVIVDERTEVSGGGKNSSASTSYYATLEFKGGRRKEYGVLHRLAGELAPGDAGLAYLKGDVLVDFRRVRV